MKTIIKGAIYINGNVLLRPHFSGYYGVVDCTEYKTKEQIKGEYSKEFAKKMLNNNYLTYDGKKYFECEYSPYWTDEMVLLSDISNLNFSTKKRSFKCLF
jgi:hypothetical protein